MLTCDLSIAPYRKGFLARHQRIYMYTDTQKVRSGAGLEVKCARKEFWLALCQHVLIIWK